MGSWKPLRIASAPDTMATNQTSLAHHRIHLVNACNIKEISKLFEAREGTQAGKKRHRTRTVPDSPWRMILRNSAYCLGKMPSLFIIMITVLAATTRTTTTT